MERQPPLVGRETEMEILEAALSRAKSGSGGLVLVGGPVGIGKTRLIEEALSLATEAGFEVGLGRSVVESFALYHPWSEALRPLHLDHLLREEPPPRLLALYLLSPAGIVVCKAERSGFTEGGAHLGMMLNNAAEFLRDAVAPSGASLERDILRFSHGRLGVVVLKAQGFGILTLLEGQETEILLNDLRRLAADVERRGASDLSDWDGNRSVSALFESFLESFLRSGKWEGIDYASDGSARKLNLFENVLFGLRRRSAEQPMVIAIDDLQWADPSSLGLLHFLARNTRDVAVVLLGTFRTEGGRASERLRDAISTLGREELGRVLEIAPLSEEASVKLASGFLGRHEIAEGALREVLRNSEGNPLFVRETLQSLESTGAIVRASSEGVFRLEKPFERLALPGRIQEALAIRLDGLSPEDRETLEVAAVCGSRFSGALVAAASGEATPKVLRRLNGIGRAKDFINAEKHGWAFRQAAIREFLYQGVAPELRRHYHREAGEFLMKAGAPPDAVGDHFALGEDPRAGPHLREAGNRALRQGASEEAALLYRRSVESTPAPGRGEVEESLSDALDLAGKGDEALQALDRARALGMPSARWAGHRAHVLCRMSRHKQAVYTVDAELAGATDDVRATLLPEIVPSLVELGEFERARESAAEALKLLPPDANTQKGRMLGAMAQAAYFRGQHVEAESLARRALEFLGPDGDKEVASGANSALGHAAFIRGDLREAEARYASSLRLSEAAGDRRGVGGAMANRAEVLRLSGEIGEALKLNLQAMEIFERVGAIEKSANTAINIGSLLEMEGQHEAALNSVERGIELARKVGDAPIVASGLTQSPFPKVALGRIGDAISDATEAVGMSEEKGMGFLRFLALEALAFARMANGDLEVGRKHFAEAVAGHMDSQSTVGAAITELYWGRSEAPHGSSEEARSLMRRAEERFAALGLERRVGQTRQERDRLGPEPRSTEVG